MKNRCYPYVLTGIAPQYRFNSYLGIKGRVIDLYLLILPNGTVEKEVLTISIILYFIRVGNKILEAASRVGYVRHTLNNAVFIIILGYRYACCHVDYPYKGW